MRSRLTGEAASDKAVVAAKEQLEEIARRLALILVSPLNSAPPPPGFVAPTEEANDEQPVMEWEGGDVTMPNIVVPPPLPTSGAWDEQPAATPVPLAENKVVTGPAPEARTPTRRPLAKAASAPWPLEAGAASSLVPDTKRPAPRPLAGYAEVGRAPWPRRPLTSRPSSGPKPKPSSAATRPSWSRGQPSA